MSICHTSDNAPSPAAFVPNGRKRPNTAATSGAWDWFCPSIPGPAARRRSPGGLGPGPPACFPSSIPTASLGVSQVFRAGEGGGGGLTALTAPNWHNSPPIPDKAEWGKMPKIVIVKGEVIPYLWMEMHRFWCEGKPVLPSEMHSYIVIQQTNDQHRRNE